MLPAVYDTSIYTLCYWECCILALVTNFTKNKKNLDLIESWGIYHIVEVQGMGANPLLVEGQNLEWYLQSMIPAYLQCVRKLNFSFAAYFTKKKKSRFNWELGEFITWFSFKARELKLSSISSRAKNSSAIYILWYQRIYTVLRS